MAQSFAPGRFYGSGAPQQFADAVFTEVAHDEARITPEHSHEISHFCLILAGSSVEHAGDRRIDCGALSMVYRASGLTHYDEILPGGARYFVVELGERWNRAVDAAGTVVDYLHEMRGGEPVWLALRLHHAVRQDEPVSLDVESLLYELCGHAGIASPVDRREPRWLTAVVRLLDEEYRGGFDLATLAGEAGVHPAHLARTFRRFQGQTVGDYVTGLRIQDACRLLLRGAAPCDVAQDVGFADQSHFTRTFKSLTGTTPGAYRRTNRGYLPRRSSTVAK